MAVMGHLRNKGLKMGAAAAAAGAAAASYMAFEAQWPRCRQAELAVPGLPSSWSGLTVLHLSDVHAGLFATNDLSFEKVVGWARPLDPDLVFLTGDMLGDRRRSARCLELLAELHPRLGMFAVTGNHEYGLGKGPLAAARDIRDLWDKAGATLLSDSCVALPPRGGARLVLCGADYLTAGFGLFEGRGAIAVCGAEVAGAGPASAAERVLGGDLTAAPLEWPAEGLPGAPAEAAGRPRGAAWATGEDFPILLIHEPPPPISPSRRCSRWPSPVIPMGANYGCRRLPVLRRSSTRRAGISPGYTEWGGGWLVVSRGVGTSFLPFRLLTRPEATLWRLV